eukprot:CAMPEP_0117804336 /NCGR_PEP_ID=MMETSP0948-20121206/17068_1 /TAXON_ID=44440 /ORGANISM="Chattonella subsalsa, Strain CCMP2191" /LENGTH=51 /DNA_ID=CAMNT_0005637913 /DNA_START=146 /DNA_END=298 /DNA_ORIENTATION=+
MTDMVFNSGEIGVSNSFLKPRKNKRLRLTRVQKVEAVLTEEEKEEEESDDD